jgi:hypothetical protein
MSAIDLMQQANRCRVRAEEIRQSALLVQDRESLTTLSRLAKSYETRAMLLESRLSA